MKKVYIKHCQNIGNALEFSSSGQQINKGTKMSVYVEFALVVVAVIAFAAGIPFLFWLLIC